MNSIILVKMALLDAQIARGKPPVDLPKLTQADARQPINAAKANEANTNPVVKPMGKI